MFERHIGSAGLEVSHKRIDHPNQSVYYNHIHNHSEILFFLSGEADYNIDGQIFRPVPYDLLFIPAATYHHLIPRTAIPYENYVIGIDPHLLTEATAEILFAPPLIFNIKDDEELKGFFDRLEFYHTHYSDEDFSICAQALIRELITYCAYRKSKLHSVHPRSLTQIEAIIAYITDHLEEPLNAERIAHHFLLSKSYVQNMFSHDMHIGLKSYIMQKKIYAAHVQLSRGMSPKEACERYSFGDYSTFYRLYKKTFGVSPQKFVSS